MADENRPQSLRSPLIPGTSGVSYSCPDPANRTFSTSDEDVASLRKKFSFLKDFSDSFIRSTPLEVLLKTETTAIKIKEFEKNKAVGSRLSANRDNLASTFYQVKSGADNRWDVIHESRFLPGACCPAVKMWLRAREVVGTENIPPPVGTYDMNAVGLGGFVSKRGWIELQDVGSDNLSLKLFNINGCGNKISSSRAVDTGDEFKEITELGEFQLALRVAREALSYVHPWNKSIAALEGFLVQSDFCKEDLTAMDKPAVVLSQFCDYVFGENADRWRGHQPFLTTGDLRSVWASFWGAKPESKLKPKSVPVSAAAGASAQAAPRKFKFDPSFFDDICRMYNLGRCVKPPGTCMTKSGIPLRHVCNHKTNPNKPQEVCGKNHIASFYH
jgi:hypothetical protein